MLSPTHKFAHFQANHMSTKVLWYSMLTCCLQRMHPGTMSTLMRLMHGHDTTSATATTIVVCHSVPTAWRLPKSLWQTTPCPPEGSPSPSTYTIGRRATAIRPTCHASSLAMIQTQSIASSGTSHRIRNATLMRSDLQCAMYAKMIAAAKMRDMLNRWNPLQLACLFGKCTRCPQKPEVRRAVPQDDV